eukprot:CAMPEP_0195512362 /NCGR_PEP_ID=MMETSP0794_2-20130614/4346_1 /TAXON_ID=515487 /ORGANISM="Stephanopyxis turris, Strain CCMP 815" /LENGTH=153 /DNA_ID=CAMNT_0040640129 /DNA_START=48 /DNA_END=510 /DNA_ORIENTATION=+
MSEPQKAQAQPVQAQAQPVQAQAQPVYAQAQPVQAQAYPAQQAQAYPVQQQHQVQQQVVVVSQPQVMASAGPVAMNCPVCHNNIQTMIQYQFGACAIATVIIFFILFWPLCFMPSAAPPLSKMSSTSALRAATSSAAKLEVVDTASIHDPLPS